MQLLWEAHLSLNRYRIRSCLGLNTRWEMTLFYCNCTPRSQGLFPSFALERGRRERGWSRTLSLENSETFFISSQPELIYFINAAVMYFTLLSQSDCKKVQVVAQWNVTRKFDTKQVDEDQISSFERWRSLRFERSSFVVTFRSDYEGGFSSLSPSSSLAITLRSWRFKH